MQEEKRESARDSEMGIKGRQPAVKYTLKPDVATTLEASSDDVLMTSDDEEFVVSTATKVNDRAVTRSNRRQLELGTMDEVMAKCMVP